MSTSWFGSNWIAVSDLVRHVKGGSSKWVHDQPGLCPDFAWQTGYAAFSVSESLEETVRSYIERQEVHHRKKSFEEELSALLRKHNVDFDPARILD